jgi:hypothetical protein
MKTIYLLSICLILFSCTENKKIKRETKVQSVVTDTTKVGNVLLELVDNNGVGELRINSNEYKLIGELRISPPCYFYRYSDNQVTDFAYPRINVSHTLVIIGNIITEEEKQYYEYNDDPLALKAQGILFKNDSIILTNRIRFDRLISVKRGFDEKDFSDFAYRPNKYTEIRYFNKNTP